MDLLRPRIAIRRPERVDFVVGALMTGTPHVGTDLTHCAAFVLASELRNAFSIDARVLFTALDNASHTIRNDSETSHPYQITYRHAMGRDDARAKAEYLYRDTLDAFSDRMGIKYEFGTYSDQQASRAFRRTFLRTLPLGDSLRWCVSPVDGIMHVRFPCPVCSWAEKRGHRTRLLAFDEGCARYEAYCVDHGSYEALVTEESGTYLDLNTLYRNLVKELLWSDEPGSLAVMVKGGDWALGCQLVDWALGIMGYRSSETPPRWFTPQVLTEVGAKLSKSLLDRQLMDVEKTDAWLLDTRKYPGVLDDYVDALTGLMTALVSDPRHFFRSYSYKEIDRLMKAQTPKELRNSGARVMRIYRKYFDLMVSGQKTIEVRVGHARMRRIRPGQLLRFVCEGSSLLMRAVAVREYLSFDELFEKEDIMAINPTSSKEQQLGAVREIYSPNKEALGVLAIELARVTGEPAL